MVESVDAFRGFPTEGLRFLSNLSENNNKGWFDAHRGVYDAAVVAPALAFVGAMGAALKAVAPAVRPEPKIGGSLFRIHRDTRFSTDKSPYKTHVGIRFRDGDTVSSPKCTGPVFYVEFDARRLRLGVGVKEFDPNTLAAYRWAASMKGTAEELSNMIRRAEGNGCAILGDVLARVPAGYENQAANALLRRKGLFVCREAPLPQEIHRPDFVTYCARWYGPYAPLFDRLRKIARAGMS